MSLRMGEGPTSFCAWWRTARVVSAGLAVLLCGQAQVAAAVQGPPVIHGRSAAVLDMADGRILWSTQGTLRVPMASTTKLMTALVALELSPDTTRILVVPPAVSEAYGELLYLRPGDQYTFMQLLEGMLLPSANDAAIALAVDTAGSLPRFVALMNARAASMGLDDTHFANPDGLDDPDHYSSADDLARLGSAAMANPVIRSVVGLRQATLPWPDHGGTRVIANINALPDEYPGADGVKTGYTSEALNLIVGSATHGDQRVIAVVTGEPVGTMWADDEHLLDYGFSLLGTTSNGTATSRLADSAVPVAAADIAPAGGSPSPHPAVTAGGDRIPGVPADGPARHRLLGMEFALSAAAIALVAAAGRARRRRRRRAVFGFMVTGPLPADLLARRLPTDAD